MRHRLTTARAALRQAAGVLLTCGALAGTALAAAGGAAPGADPGPAVVRAAERHIGDAYVWGATGPKTWDCSGLTSRMWRDVGGVSAIPRIAGDQQAWAVPIPAAQLLPGDLVFFGDPVTHVGLYAGGGRIVDASSSRRGVVTREIWTGGVIRYGRVRRPTMPAVIPWTASGRPAASGSPAHAATAPEPTGQDADAAGTTPSAALRARPLRGLPARDLPSLSPVASRAIGNARSVLGSRAWTDLGLVRGAWRHAGGGLLPSTRAELVARATTVPTGAARIGDLIVYGTPAGHLGLYLGHGYMIDVSAGRAGVVIRRVFASPSVRIMRLPSR